MKFKLCDPSRCDRSRYLSAGSLSCVATILAIIYWLSRLGLRDNSPWMFINVLPLSYFIFLFPVFLADLKLSSSFIFLLISNLAFVVMMGLVSNYLPFSIWPIFSVVGVFLFIGYGVCLLKSFRLVSVFVSLMGLIAFSLIIANAAWCSGYENPFFLEQLASGYVHPDTLFHSSIASMIKTHGVPGTGLNGIPYLPYHFGSHWIFAQFSKLLNISSLQFYLLGYPIIFIPLFFYSLLLFIIELKKIYGEEVVSWNFLKDRFFLAVFFIFLLEGFVFGFITEYFHLKSLITSESYCVSLSLSFLFAAFLLKIDRNHFQNSTGYFWKKWFLLTALLFVVTLTKISTGCLLLVILAYLFVRLGYFRFPRILLAFGVTCVLFLIEFSLIVPVPSYWFNRIVGESTVPEMAVLALFFVKTLPSLFYITYRLWEVLTERQLSRQSGSLAVSTNEDMKVMQTKDSLVRVYRSKLFDLEIICILLFAILGSFFAMRGNGGFDIFFTDVNKWFAFALFLSILPRFKRHWDQLMPKKIFRLPVLALSFYLLTLTAIHFLYDARDFFGRLVFYRYRIIEQTNAKDVFFQDVEVMKTLLKSGNISQLMAWFKTKYFYLKNQPQVVLDQNNSYNLLKKIESFSKLRENEKERSAIYVPRSNATYWNMQVYCYVSPFIAPALSEMSLIAGLPEDHCYRMDLSYSSYDRNDFPHSSADLSHEDLAAEAYAKGFQQVMVLHPDGSSEIIPVNGVEIK